MNFNVALDAKSLNSMTQSGKFNFRHFKQTSSHQR